MSPCVATTKYPSWGCQYLTQALATNDTLQALLQQVPCNTNTYIYQTKSANSIQPCVYNIKQSEFATGFPFWHTDTCAVHSCFHNGVRLLVKVGNVCHSNSSQNHAKFVTRTDTDVLYAHTPLQLCMKAYHTSPESTH